MEITKREILVSATILAVMVGLGVWLSAPILSKATERYLAVASSAVVNTDDEFDYIFYTYGLKLYKKMPLIEPLEYKDVKKIREFVIAIDTSGSVQGELVQTFLQKTYNIMMNI